MIRLLFVIIITVAPSFVWAFTPTARVSVKLLSGEGFAPQRDFEAQPIWEKNEEGAFEFFWRVRIDLPAGKTVRNVSGVTSVFGKVAGTPEVDNKTEETGHLIVNLKATSDRVSVTFDDGNQAVLQLGLNIPAAQRVLGACEDLGLAIEPILLSTPDAQVPQAADSAQEPTAAAPPKVDTSAIPKLPGYVYFRCDLDATPSSQGTVLSVSVPEEVQWRSTSLYEMQGKGKRYKSFLINPQVAKTGETEIGKFRFLRAGKEYAFVLRVPKPQDLLRMSNFTFGLGGIQMTLQASDKTSQALKPTAIISFEFRPFWPRLVFGGHGISSLPMVGQGKLFTHTESVGFVGYTYGGDGGFRYEPRFYFYGADGVSQEIDYFYNIAAPAVGGLFASPKRGRWRYSLEGFFGVLGGQKVTSLRASVGRQVGFGEWGVRAISNSVGVNLDNAKKATGGQMAAGIYLEF